MTKTRPPVQINNGLESARTIARATIIGAILGASVTAITAIGIKIYDDRSKANNIPTETKAVEIVKAQVLQNALMQAKDRIKATGYFINYISPDELARWVKDSPDLKAEIILVDPLGVNKVVCQRQNDEDNQASNFEKILSKIKDFHGSTKNLLGNKLDLRVIDVYPTMCVIIVDRDLYAYFYPYKELGTDSPILKFSNYKENKDAIFFTRHLNTIFERAKPINTDSQFQPYKSDKLPDPCISTTR